MSNATVEAVGMSSRSNCNRFGSRRCTSTEKAWSISAAVLEFTTSSRTGSSPVVNTIGIDAVAAFAACAGRECGRRKTGLMCSKRPARLQ
jgi:hypothetical protein